MAKSTLQLVRVTGWEYQFEKNRQALGSFFRRPQLSKQRVHGLMQLRQVILCIIPDEFRHPMLIAMGQYVAKVNNLAHLRDSFGKTRVELLQAVYRLANDPELAFNRGLCQRIGNIDGSIHSVCERFDIGAGLVDILQQDARISLHRQVRVTG